MKKTILYFSADWCVPCKTTLPNVSKITGKYHIPLEIHDIDSEYDLAIQYNVCQVPTIVKLINDSEVARLYGAQTPYAIDKFVSTD